ncbi:hypothetical protein HanRHA438_Chr15g0715741 [Helianthus annuus]|uniref:Transmembrane protein n=2 Tax=Helianthus annuus TaxID=4232 RepID=A0A9K3H2U1_HELAN|nr:hypothetical protein HanXRQr2_Chr15g0703401 [Helianthus annuus]KAJ0456664.1 hypothetical protein HanIR_Chr15g0765041 [Helianthus annuus]KAJ0832096.1 hypothetical protein HanPSC8_Chr15g0674841 [Helianthus annuus]KAJ0845619.1 hypothetical protein HanRHA438_Chr15g0715741 [Helianthus annuus]
MCSWRSDTLPLKSSLSFQGHNNHKWLHFLHHTLNGQLVRKIMGSMPMMQSPQFLISNSLTLDPLSSTNCFSARICHPNVQSPSRKSIITCARSTNKGFFRSQRSRKTLIQLARFAASNFHHVLPEPFNSVIRELGGGSGGGSGSNWKGFGWGGFDGGGRKKRVNKKSQFWLLGFAVACCLGFWWLNMTGRLEKNDVVLGAMCLSMFLVLVRNVCVPEWVLGFCGGGVVVGVLVDKKDELQKVVRGFKTMGISRRQPRRRMKIK